MRREDQCIRAIACIVCLPLHCSKLAAAVVNCGQSYKCNTSQMHRVQLMSVGCERLGVFWTDMHHMVQARTGL